MQSLNRPPSYVLCYRLNSSFSAKSVYVFLSDLTAIKYSVLQNELHKEVILASIVFAFPIIHNLHASKKVLFRLFPFILDVPRGLQLGAGMSCPVSPLPIFLSLVDSHAAQ